MIDKTLLKYIEIHKNGYIILNNKKRVIYANTSIKELFSNDVDQLFGDFSMCNNIVMEKKCCQETSKCKKCVINNALNKILEDRETKIIKSIEFNFNSKIFNITCQLDYIDGYIIIEFINIERIEEETYLLNRILNSSKDLLFYKDSNLRYKYVNNSYINFLGMKKKDIIGRCDEEILPKEMVKTCVETDRITLKRNLYSGIEIVGDRYYRVLKECINGGIMCVGQDITEEIRLYNESNIDELTKLGNRRKFNSSVEKIYKRKDNDYYLILIDIDDFSSVNNNLGHDIGDMYLKELSLILSRYSDLEFFRLGGDEFIGLISSNIKKVEKRITTIFRDLYSQKKIMISMGVKKLDLNISYNENYKLLDETLYISKRKGKNQVSYY